MQGQEEIILFLLFLIGIPSLSLFIWKTYQPGMIFRRAYLFFIYHYIKNWRQKDRWRRWFIKPFICFYCYNTWLSILGYTLWAVSLSTLPLLVNIALALPFAGLSYIIIEFLFKKVVV